MIQFSYTNKVAIITGSAIGIGFEIAKQLVKAGASVVINDIDGKALEKAINKLKDMGAKCTSVKGNSGDLNVIQSIVEKSVSEFGRLDFVIANSGITTFGDFIHYKLEEFQTQYQWLNQ